MSGYLHAHRPNNKCGEVVLQRVQATPLGALDGTTKTLVPIQLRELREKRAPQIWKNLVPRPRPRMVTLEREAIVWDDNTDCRRIIDCIQIKFKY
jgi:hypothetical protein